MSFETTHQPRLVITITGTEHIASFRSAIKKLAAHSIMNTAELTPLEKDAMFSCQRVLGNNKLNDDE